MCGGHRRKPPSEENEEEPEDAGTTTASGENGGSQAIALSSLKPANAKFVLGPPVETTPPIVVFTGPADHPDTAVQTASAAPKKKKKVAAKADGADKGAKSEEAAKPKTAKPAKTKPKVSATTQ